MDNLGFVPPHDERIEEAVLCAIMIEAGTINEVYDLISAETFYKTHNVEIYKAIVKLFKDSKQIDLLTITDQLRKDDKLDEIGGAFKLSQISSLFSSAANIEHHCAILKQLQLQRYFITFGQQQMGLVAQNKDVSENLELFNEAKMEVENILSFGSQARPLMKNIDISIEQAYSRAYAVRKGEIVGIDTGLKELNRKLTWREEELIIIAARPGMGKTALCLKHAKAAAQSGNHVRVYSLEMSDIALTDRLLLSESNITASDFRDGYLNDVQLQSLEQSAQNLHDLNIWIDDKPARTVSSIAADAKKHHLKEECDLIIIDYLQLTESETKYGSTNDKVGQITRGLKKLAKELKIPIIVLSQLSRAVEQRPDKMPQLSDLRDSGNIEQDADKVLFIYRPAYYNIMEDEEFNSLEGIGFYIIDKNRTGACGEVKWQHNESLTQIYDYSDRDEPLEPSNDF